MIFNPNDYEPVLDSVQIVQADFRINGNEVIQFNNIQNAFSINSIYLFKQYSVCILTFARRYIVEILPIQRQTPNNQSNTLGQPSCQALVRSLHK